jgi:hypothetical protein
MTRLFWDNTVPFHDTVPIEHPRKVYVPAGCDQQGRQEPGWQQSQFDGRGEWSLLGLELLALSAVIVISIVAWLV